MAKFVSPFLRSFGNYDVDAASKEVALVCPPEEGVTQQQFAEEVDINTIVKRFGLTGELPENVRMPQSGDFTGISDYKSAMDAVANAQSAFMELPGDMRARFDNDPQKLMDFLAVDKNRDEAIALGLVAPPAEVTRDVVTAVDELAARFPQAEVVAKL